MTKKENVLRSRLKEAQRFRYRLRTFDQSESHVFPAATHGHEHLKPNVSSSSRRIFGNTSSKLFLLTIEHMICGN
jgi:hypothetical protein